MTERTERSRYEPTFSLGNLVNLLALVAMTASCVLYVSTIERDATTAATMNAARIDAIERRMDRESTEVLRRLERIETKIETVQEDVSTLKASTR